MRLDFTIKVSFVFDYIFIEETSLSESVAFHEFAAEVIEQYTKDCLTSIEICNTIKSDVDYLLKTVVGGTDCDYDIKSMEVSCRTNKSSITLSGSINFEFEEESELSDSSFDNETDMTDKFTQYIIDEIIQYDSIVDLEPFYMQLEPDDPVRFTFEYKIESCESKLIKE